VQLRFTDFRCSLRSKKWAKFGVGDLDVMPPKIGAMKVVFLLRGVQEILPAFYAFSFDLVKIQH
jgi:hypothetical protein